MFSDNFNKGNILSRWIVYLFQARDIDNNNINYEDIYSSYDPFKLGGIK